MERVADGGWRGLVARPLASLLHSFCYLLWRGWLREAGKNLWPAFGLPSSLELLIFLLPIISLCTSMPITVPFCCRRDEAAIGAFGSPSSFRALAPRPFTSWTPTVWPKWSSCPRPSSPKVSQVHFNRHFNMPCILEVFSKLVSFLVESLMSLYVPYLRIHKNCLCQSYVF